MEIEITKQAQKSLIKAPKHIQGKFDAWVESILEDGLTETRKNPGFHDELLEGERKGQRSVRLNNQWRIFYTETQKGIQIMILEVTPHDYRRK